MKKSLKQRWMSFFNVAVDPMIAILSAMNLVLVCINIYNDNRLMTLISSLLIVLISGIIGAKLVNIRTDCLTDSILHAKGRITIRNLVLMIENIGVIKKRIQIYISRQNEEQSRKSTILAFEELVEKCNILEREVINSIESWADIIPDANISIKLEDINRTSKYIKREKILTEKLKRELELLKAKPDKEKEELKNIIIEKSRVIFEKEREIEDKVDSINSSILGGINIYSLSKFAGSEKITADVH